MNLSEILIRNSKDGDTDKLVYVHTFKSPVGNIIAGVDQDFLYFVCFEDSKNLDKIFKTVSKKLSCEFIEGKNKILKILEYEIQEYFDGKLKRFTVPIKTFGSEFQKEVWDKLMEIPYGTTQTYGTLAQEMGRPASHSRAVGAACGANAHVLVIPCHRLVATGSKGGFSCGVDRKEWLIKHEKQFA
ncbi:methylated-DNA--protein-cysteine methyltransferase [Maniola hyperantus]|uniref:methylated-DNA--protein-cysteine methyltransferase n=1 Tax=Aphantopus hyperantus TaxID=2795564 RepID=UPI0015683378|nr:methylated-DNA--protein-cysteine methyltransferase [Maniola hyperantus]